MNLCVTNISASPGATFAGIQLVEVPDDSPVPGQPVSPPQGSTVLNLILPIEEASGYPVGSRWELSLRRSTATGPTGE